jgi:hypothetical protein
VLQPEVDGIASDGGSQLVDEALDGERAREDADAAEERRRDRDAGAVVDGAPMRHVVQDQGSLRGMWVRPGQPDPEPTTGHELREMERDVPACDPVLKGADAASLRRCPEDVVCRRAEPTMAKLVGKRPRRVDRGTDGRRQAGRLGPDIMAALAAERGTEE